MRPEELLEEMEQSIRSCLAPSDRLYLDRREALFAVTRPVEISGFTGRPRGNAWVLTPDTGWLSAFAAANPLPAGELSRSLFRFHTRPDSSPESADLLVRGLKLVRLRSTGALIAWDRDVRQWIAVCLRKNTDGALYALALFDDFLTAGESI